MVCKYKAIKINGIKYDEHRYVMEKSLGRKLNRYEVVHHKDENKLNNNIENLEIISLSKHSRNHMIGNTNAKGKLKNTHKFKEGLFWCNKCKKYLSKENFYKNNARKFNISCYCKLHTNASLAQR